jgi:hypothetical protein
MSPQWMEHAECVGANPTLFAPREEDEPQPEFNFRVRVATSYCRRCPVKAECAKAGNDGNEWGVWGGEARGDRDRRRRRAAAVVATPDEVLVGRLMRGEQLPSRAVDRREAALRLHAQGLPATAIGVRIGCTKHNVNRIIARYGKTQVTA